VGAAAEAVAAAEGEVRARRGRVLIIAPAGSYRTAPFVAAARGIGAEVLIASEGRYAISADNAPGLHISLGDPALALERLLSEHARTPFSAIIGTDDASTELAAQASASIGLPHNPVASARIARRKDYARAQLARAGVPVPRHWVLDLGRSLASQIEAITYPCVLKPVSLSASRGVIRANDREELLRACARIQAILREQAGSEEGSRILVEQFIPGAEVAVEGLLTDGRLDILAVFDKPDPLEGPFFEETYYVTPSRHSPAVQADLREAIAAACCAYGLMHGPIHAECRINEAGVWILEVAARTIGGLCARLLRFGTGYGLEELVIRHALGERLEPRKESGGAGVLMIPIPEAGILRRVEGVLAAEKVRFVEEVIIDVREGYELVPLPEGSQYLGFIYARAPSAAQAEEALRAAHACLRIVVAPVWKVAVN
jgi:biotin carboxylase